MGLVIFFCVLIIDFYCTLLDEDLKQERIYNFRHNTILNNFW